MKKIKSIHINIERNQGFTLIEILIAMFILTVAILALVSVTVMVIKGNSLNRMMNTATTLAKDQLETVKNTSQPDDPNDTSSFASISFFGLQNVVGFPGYQIQQMVDPIDNANSLCTGNGTGTCPDKKNVAVEVHWQWQGIDHKVSFNTIITRK